MGDVSVLQHYLVSFLMQSPSHVLVIIVSNRVELLIDGINKDHPSGSYPKFHRLTVDMYLLVTFPPIFNMGEGFKEREADLFSVREILNKVIPF
jgi:hypothetical protein